MQRYGRIWQVVGMVIVSCMLAHCDNAHAEFINGGFETGDLTGWKTEVLLNGTIGEIGLPRCLPFETEVGKASVAANFRVGKLDVRIPRISEPSGGGIYQELAISAGLYRVSAKFASVNNSLFRNIEPGRLSLLVDDVVVWQDDRRRSIGPNEIQRGGLESIVNVEVAGMHKFSFLFLRAGEISDMTPMQYLDDIRITSIPEPPSLVVVALVLPKFFGRQLRNARDSIAANN